MQILPIKQGLPIPARHQSALTLVVKGNETQIICVNFFILLDKIFFKAQSIAFNFSCEN